MSREYIKCFVKLEFILFVYILAHGRMLEKYSFGLEAMSCTWLEQSLHINLFEHEIGMMEC